jgi:hypothetical protein
VALLERTHEPTLGSKALKNSRYEALARERAAGATMADAWRAIGRDPAKSNNQARVFRRPEVQARVEYLRDEWNRLAGLSLAALQARLLRIADANVVSFFEADEKTGQLRLRDLTKLPASVTAPITELRIDADGAIKLKTADQLRAIENLLKTIGAFVPDGTEGDQGPTIEQLIEMSQRPDRPTAVRMEVISGLSRSSDDRATAKRATYSL